MIYCTKQPNQLTPHIIITMKTLDTIKIISEKHKAKATGGLFLLDEHKKLLQIYFAQGDMVSIKTRNLHGKDALKELMGMKPIKFQFHDGAETHNIESIPSTKDIIQQLSATKNENNQQKLLPDHLEDKARDLFVEYVGPIADVIFEEQIERSASLDNLIHTLSSYIEDDKDKRAFIDAAKEIA
ncbi:MAG: hypothetical protein ACI9D5_002558 [Candidatus Endobugula sp.]|jgi:hypothetical protein